MGHEYVEMKNSHAAIEAYRRAVGRSLSPPLTLLLRAGARRRRADTPFLASWSAPDCNPRDYRAWYGLGQTYELLDMPQYAISYYNKATALRCVSLSAALLRAPPPSIRSCAGRLTDPPPRARRSFLHEQAVRLAHVARPRAGVRQL